MTEQSRPTKSSTLPDKGARSIKGTAMTGETSETVTVTTESIAPFVGKLWNLVSDPETDRWIRWDDGGQMFHVHDASDFSKNVLPEYFKHNNMASFVRQLNMYGFRKVVMIDQRTMKSDSDDMTFQHRFFVRDRIDMIQFIKRKLTPSHAHSDLNAEQVSHLITQVTDIKSKQDDVTESLENLKQENDTLWREIIYLRNQHSKQEKVVNTLIHFLMSMFNPQRATAGKKRHFMIESGGSSSTADGSRGSSGGVVIKDVTNEAASPSSVDNAQNSARAPVLTATVPLPSVASPSATLPSVTLPDISLPGVSQGNVTSKTIPPGVTLTHPRGLPRQISDDLSSHVSNVDGELQMLKELFDGGNIDDELLAGLFSGDVDLTSDVNLALTDGSSQTVAAPQTTKANTQHTFTPPDDFAVFDSLPSDLFQLDGNGHQTSNNQVPAVTTVTTAVGEPIAKKMKK